MVISDLHMGLGRDAEGAWHPTEDFRWPTALEGFLDAIAAETSGVDLVIAGDFLELWQRPASNRCAGPPAGWESVGSDNYDCTVDELVALTRLVIGAHRRELAALSRFAARDGTCLVVIPGNHDAGLVIDPVWEPLEKALRADEGCVRRAKDGVWTSGSLTVEHGHQIGSDPNRYPDWTAITRRLGGKEYVRSPWGERFVQRIFNSEEAEYPLIDNLSPSSAGARYRMRERGLGGTAADLARFVRFNLFETTLHQKSQILGEPGEEEDETAGEAERWDLDGARAMGHRLFAGALDADDPLAEALRGEGEEAAELRAALDEVASTLPDEEVVNLCDQLAIRKAEEGCRRPTLGFAASKLLISRERVLRKHLDTPRGYRTRRYVYGHTHAFELPWELRPESTWVIQVANSGAFQRLIDDAQLKTLAKSAGITPAQYLRRHTPEDLPACYTSVHVTPRPRGGAPRFQVRAWYQPEEAETGRFVDPCTEPCPRVGHGCGE